jgi:hypothetical protein
MASVIIVVETNAQTKIVVNEVILLEARPRYVVDAVVVVICHGRRSKHHGCDVDVDIMY